MINFLKRLWPVRSFRMAADVRDERDRALLAAVLCPPITPEERAAAQARLDAAKEQFVMVNFGGGPQKFYTGKIDLNDVRKVEGHVIRVAGYDKWGYPETN